MNIILAEKKHKDYKRKLDETLRDEQLNVIDILAIVSQFTGMLIAMQDQRKYTSEQIMKLVADNIQAGNKAAIAEVLSATGKAN